LVDSPEPCELKRPDALDVGDPAEHQPDLNTDEVGAEAAVRSVPPPLKYRFGFRSSRIQ
jgi:hypothetical protein